MTDLRPIIAGVWTLVAVDAAALLYAIIRDTMHSRRVERANAAQVEARLAQLRTIAEEARRLAQARAQTPIPAGIARPVQDASPPQPMHSER